jgi:hypothetical protein
VSLSLLESVAVALLACSFVTSFFLLLHSTLQIQGQRVEVAKLDAERAALSRLDKIRLDQGARATALEKEAAASEERATLIEYNLEAVDAAIDAVNAGVWGWGPPNVTRSKATIDLHSSASACEHIDLTDMQACARHRAWKDAALCSAHETACLIDRLLLSSVNMNM